MVNLSLTDSHHLQYSSHQLAMSGSLHHGLSWRAAHSAISGSLAVAKADSLSTFLPCMAVFPSKKTFLDVQASG